jgi:DNA-binding NtrC family response regulator
MTPPLVVLVVDDDPTALALLRAVLEEIGCRVHTAERPAEALRRLEAETPDLLVTDLRMPELSGLDLIRQARRLHPHLGCLLVTGFATDEVVTEAFRAGVLDLLSKPLNIAEGQARIARAGEIVRLRAEVARLREELAAQRTAGAAEEPPSRSGELGALPALPGSQAPVELGGAEGPGRRLDRLAALLRQGLITTAEYEERRRAILDQL